VTVIHPTKELEDKQAKRFEILSGFFSVFFLLPEVSQIQGA
jgi:hypothetical protein